ncbi:MAG: translocase [Streptosporangiales bacterium]|nr:translocase [Streptosporangiales bacterium]
MFDVGFGEAAVLAVLALLIFGPERLPKMAAQAGRALRQLRQMANNAQNDLKAGLGPEFRDMDVADLNPRRFVRKHLWEDEDDPSSRPEEATVASGGLDYGERPPFDREAT